MPSLANGVPGRGKGDADAVGGGLDLGNSVGRRFSDLRVVLVRDGAGMAARSGLQIGVRRRRIFYDLLDVVIEHWNVAVNSYYSISQVHGYSIQAES